VVIRAVHGLTGAENKMGEGVTAGITVMSWLGEKVEMKNETE
jgi:hypothetical protein